MESFNVRVLAAEILATSSQCRAENAAESDNIDIINNILLKIRSGANENGARNYFELLLAVICDIIKPVNLNNILKEYTYKSIIRR